MPFTPFHLGPGAALKAVAGKRFSFVFFCLTQALIDMETLYFLARNEWPVHRFFHTYMGATIMLVAVLLLGGRLCEAVLRAWNAVLSPGQERWLYIEPKISPVAAAAGASLGVYSHVFLDSIMHSDLRPFAPVTDANSMLNAITVGELHLLCVLSGAFGIMVLLAVLLWNKWTYKV